MTTSSAKIVRQRAVAIPDDRLLFTRKQVMRMLGGISYPTVIRLEKAGKLPPVKLKPGKTCKAFYRRADVMALVET
ncbi:helix-turn-helix transcriptional regulator [Bradyrhizobium sp. USDA 336]|uniref:helix-turn-helix transcriptional regulator n=1 Tax=Bradyrhizobium sp. USDA 336 TaxID=3156311 RepID=UPI0038389C06